MILTSATNKIKETRNSNHPTFCFLTTILTANIINETKQKLQIRIVRLKTVQEVPIIVEYDFSLQKRGEWVFWMTQFWQAKKAPYYCAELHDARFLFFRQQCCVFFGFLVLCAHLVQNASNAIITPQTIDAFHKDSPCCLLDLTNDGMTVEEFIGFLMYELS